MQERKTRNVVTKQLAMATNLLAMASWQTEQLAMATNLLTMASVDSPSRETLHFHSKTLILTP